MKVFVIQDCDGEVVGVASGPFNTGRATGFKVGEFTVNRLPQIGENDRPWVVYFNEADCDKPQLWPIKGFPEEEMSVHQEGIEVIVYAVTPAEALTKAYGRTHFDSWDVAVSDWEAIQ